MEKKSFNWMLFQLSQRKIGVNILEVGICERDKLVDWYCLDNNGSIHRNQVSAPTNMTKYLLNYFLCKRSPMLDEYTPEKFVCYLYHKTGRKIIKAKEASEMAKNQLHGLHVQSIHMALPQVESQYIYRVYCTNRNNELYTEITVQNFQNEKVSNLKDQEIADKIMNFTLKLCQALARLSKPLKSMQIDLILSYTGQVYLIKTNELVFSSGNNNEVKEFHMVKSFHVFDEDSEEDNHDENQGITLNYNPEKDIKKKDPHKFKIPLNKPLQTNSALFLDMIAKTIQKNRKKKQISEYFSQKLLANDAESLIKHNLASLPSLRDSQVESGISSINDLLLYLEKTRQKNWVKDTYKTSQLTVKNLLYKNPQYVSRRGSYGNVQDFAFDSISNKEIKSILYKKSQVVYNIKGISPVKLSNNRSQSISIKLPSFDTKYKS
jgi:uncharacterized protein YjhX (UPF0386 family)